MDRRKFLISSAGAVAAGAGYVLYRGGEESVPITGSILGASESIGHLLRDGGIPGATEERRAPVVIVGGGVSGLSAGWKLQKAGFEGFEILELESEVGGNARFGENSVTPYPWGAHYVPAPTEESSAVRELFEELEVIEGYTAEGQPIYQERALCFAPQERLYMHGVWQEDLLPVVGATQRDTDQYTRFSEMIASYARYRGADGRKAFAIPMEMSSRDPELLALDGLSMRAFLEQNGFDSGRLHWYVNYACRDDYGCTSADVSAWIGLHYFASRHSGEGSESAPVLTWPEGNGWIVRQLRNRLETHITTDALVFRIELQSDGAAVHVYHLAQQRSVRILAEDVVFACPYYLAPYLIADAPEAIRDRAGTFDYAPWMVANLTLRAFPTEKPGQAPVSWDNVIYESDSLGYVVATHQSLRTHQQETVYTYYYPLSGASPSEERTRLLNTEWSAWTDMILDDLSVPHPDIHRLVRQVDIFRWGHAMVRPRPGFLWSDTRRRAANPHGPIHFAHSDLSGFSIFEEANYRGVVAAERILGKYGVPFKTSV